MRHFASLIRGLAVVPVWFLMASAFAQRQIPDALRDWQDWATWDVEHRECPTPADDASKALCFWPGVLSISADSRGSGFEMEVTVFSESWVPLPGGAKTWPGEVRSGEGAVVVVERDGHPAVRLDKGVHRLAGSFSWQGEMPQVLRVPQEIGVLSLVVDGRAVEIPNWDESGDLWLKRVRTAATDKDALAAQVWRVIEDGNPLWLRTEIELSVSGRSREEELGHALPAGWKPAAVQSPLPVAVDESGRMKAQVRAGKWRISLDAFRTEDVEEIRFAEGVTPLVAEELIGFRAAPEFRSAELEGLRMVDVSQTTFPERWRNLPVYQWSVEEPFRLVERMRGMGLQKPEGLRIERTLWLDDDGGGVTFRDLISGTGQSTWRLDIAGGRELGAAKVGDEAQLVTTNPANGAAGVEIRSRNLAMEAIGRSDEVGRLSATGWQTPAEGVDVMVHLPPGWRLFALFGADWTQGDWLTAWTLLDLFLLLIFTLAASRLCGWKAGVLAFLAFGLAYHEPGAPRYVWLLLLVPIGLLKVVPEGKPRQWVNGVRLGLIGFLIVLLVPFVTRQVQGVMYPQLEESGLSYGERPYPGRSMSGVPSSLGVSLASKSRSYDELEESQGRMLKAKISSNLAYDAEAKIQTGPAMPQWSWNEVAFGWNGPVSAEETVRPVFISLTMHRVLTVLRVVLLLALAGLLIRSRRDVPPARKSPPPVPGAAVAALLVFAVMWTGRAAAQIPGPEMLSELRERLLEKPDVFPHAAELPEVSIRLDGNRLTMTAEVHAAARVAVPLPGRLPAWSPVAVTLDGDARPALRRDDGYLWLVVPEGVHVVTVEGRLPETTEWEWGFALKPRKVVIDAPGWSVVGVGPNGVPENPVFFSRKNKGSKDEADYDRKDFNVLVGVERHLEIGLQWQVRTVVRRLSSPGKAVSLQVPLLAGEKVLNAQVEVRDGRAEVRLGAGEDSIEWRSELPPGEAIELTAPPSERRVERWHLVTSPVWNVDYVGLEPVFESGEESLVPVWHPWPGESVRLLFARPQAISGDTVTVRRVDHEVSLGARQSSASLTLEVEASLGDDFLVSLDPAAEITLLQQDGQAIPVRREEGSLIVPVHPGAQTLRVEWRSERDLGFRAAGGEVGLPVEAANVSTRLLVPDSRWVLWANGPLRGPAVRFWTVLVVSLMAAWVLGGLKGSPLKRYEWMLLSIGLTQIELGAALLVVGWFFLLAWRGRMAGRLAGAKFDLLQLALAGLTVIALIIVLEIVRRGLLGHPEMFIRGNGSTRTSLSWFEPRGGEALPQPYVLSVSVWWYRLLMLAWALWLAASLIRWLKWAWQQFSAGGFWQKVAPPRSGKPPLPPRA